MSASLSFSADTGDRTRVVVSGRAHAEVYQAVAEFTGRTPGALFGPIIAHGAGVSCVGHFSADAT